MTVLARLCRQPIALILIVILLGLSACGEKDDKKTDTNQSTNPPVPSSTPTSAPDTDTASALTPFTGQNTITLPDGSSVTFQYSLNYPENWTIKPGEITNFVHNREPMKFPMESGSIEISFSFRAFTPPSIATMEQVFAGAPTTALTLAGYEGLRADFRDESATHSEGSTIVLQLDDNTYVFITLQMAFGERASLEPVALGILNSLAVTIQQN